MRRLKEILGHVKERFTLCQGMYSGSFKNKFKEFEGVKEHKNGLGNIKEVENN